MGDFGREALLAIVLLLVGGLSVAYLVIVGRYGQAARAAVGVVLVLVGYGLRLADTLAFLPDVLMPEVDDEGAVATLFGLVAMLVGGIVILLPASNVLELRTQWTLSIFALLVLVLLVVHVVSTFSIEG